MNITRQIGLRAPMPDGVELVADAWLPAQGGPWPVLLQRLPYGRSVASTPVLPHPTWFARRGYAVVVQDCRGRGDSGGTFEPFVHEGPDGAASIEWAARLPFCDGRVATYGFSYQGISQLYAAAERPPSLRAIAPMMCCPDPYEGWFYEGGAARWPFVCFWAAQLAGQELRQGPMPFNPSALPRSTALGPNPPRWFNDWLAHPTDDEYWAARRPNLEHIEVPAFSVLGWFDDFSSGTAAVINRLDAHAWCGPWAHMPWGTQHGGVEFGSDASPAPVWDALAHFFDGVFQREGARLEEPSVRFHVLGEGWRTTRSWPPRSTELVLHGVSASGNANSRWGDGLLASAPAPSHPSTLVAEPHVPVPGGAVDYEDEGNTHDRRDVLCFTGEPLGADLVLAGSPVVELATRCDRPSHDIVATLCIVGAGESARVVTSYAQRAVSPAAPQTERSWELTLRPMAVRLARGERLRLTIAASRFPCFDRNPHTGSLDPDVPESDHVVATIAVHSVMLRLPAVDAGP